MNKSESVLVKVTKADLLEFKKTFKNA